MKIEFEQLVTFGLGVRAYRIVPESDCAAVPLEGANRVDTSHKTVRTDNAKQLGDRLREQLQREPQAVE